MRARTLCGREYIATESKMRAVSYVADTKRSFNALVVLEGGRVRVKRGDICVRTKGGSIFLPFFPCF